MDNLGGALLGLLVGLLEAGLALWFLIEMIANC